MRIRDVALVTAIVVIAGFAVADAVRRPAARPETATTPRPVAPRVGNDRIMFARTSTFRSGAARGWLVFTDARDCRVRELDVASGAERPLRRLAGDCRLWAPRTGPRIAYGLGGGRGERVPFRFVDVTNPDRDLGGHTAHFGVIVWRTDGKRVAWCGRGGQTFDLELGGPVRRIRGCPAAYDPRGELAFADGNRVVVDGRTELAASGHVTAVSYGVDGSTAISVDARRVERWKDGRRLSLVDLPARLHGRHPAFSPDACAALFAHDGAVELVDLGCFRGRAQRPFAASARSNRPAAWSPDGDWIAVAEDATIAFHRVVGPRETLRYPAAAAQLAWRD